VEKHPFTAIFSARPHHRETSRFEVSFYLTFFNGGGLLPCQLRPLLTVACLVLTLQSISPIALRSSLDSMEILLPVASSPDGLVTGLVTVSEARTTVNHGTQNLTVIPGLPPQFDNTLIDCAVVWD
jgi:hypothetical protein